MHCAPTIRSTMEALCAVKDSENLTSLSASTCRMPIKPAVCPRECECTWAHCECVPTYLASTTFNQECAPFESKSYIRNSMRRKTRECTMKVHSARKKCILLQHAHAHSERPPPARLHECSHAHMRTRAHARAHAPHTHAHMHARSLARAQALEAPPTFPSTRTLRKHAYAKHTHLRVVGGHPDPAGIAGRRLTLPSTEVYKFRPAVSSDAVLTEPQT